MTARNDDNQSPMDMAMQCYANPEGLWKLAIENNIPSLTDPLPPGTTLTFIETRMPNQQEFLRRKIRVATANSTPPPPTQPGAFNDDFNDDYDNAPI